MKTRKLLLWNIFINWGLMAVMCLLMAASYAMSGFPFPKFGVLLTIAGLIWSMAGLAYCVIALYFAWRQKILKIWGCSLAMSCMSFYSFMTVASTY